MSKVLILLLIGLVVCAQASRQSTSVKGSITCRGKAVGGLKVKLIDEAGGKEIGRSLTDDHGFYSVAGSTSHTFRTIKPVVQIRYNCGNWFEQCYKFKIPKDHITKGDVPKKTFDASRVELSSVKHNC
ncbi:hypothetical protein M3Y97_00653400 [Aphelenchoides bicaudatus]|nr:hypothetical protein M3Y97_00653400 [Aphelenchoides bicaudatus]